MNINDVNSQISKQIPQSAKNTAEQVEKQHSGSEQKVERTDQSGQDTIVNLSPALKEAEAIKEIIESEPDIREEKVAELKARIDSGSYTIDHQAVADKLVDSFIDEIS
jgi:negative regulator of flagellin synthesis FlgM